jgi:aspartate/methionine/tyrosine aminotransferase
MNIEFEIDDFRGALRSSIVQRGAEEMLHQECHKVLEKHRKAMIEELDKVISSFTVHCIREPQTAITKVKITLPDA